MSTDRKSLEQLDPSQAKVIPIIEDSSNCYDCDCGDSCDGDSCDSGCDCDSCDGDD